MRKLFVLTFLAVAAASQAVVTSIGVFPAPVVQREPFNMAAGPYNFLPIWSGFGVAFPLPSGQLLVSGPPAQSPPNALSGLGADVMIRINGQKKRFGGWFRNYVLSSGVAATAVNFKFFDVNGTPIGSQTMPLTSTFLWIGFKTSPKWTRVEIRGNIPGNPGGVLMDDIRYR